MQSIHHSQSLRVRAIIHRLFFCCLWYPDAYNGDLTGINKAVNVMDNINENGVAFSIFVGDIKVRRRGDSLSSHFKDKYERII